jgi:chloramphenicol 3-O-phosphotransferase
MLEASARRWRSKHPGRRAIQVAPGVVEIALSIRVGRSRSARANALLTGQLATPMPQPVTAHRPMTPPVMPIGTTVALGAPPAAPAPVGIKDRELLPVEALRPAAEAAAEAAPEVIEPVIEAPVEVEPEPTVLESAIPAEPPAAFPAPAPDAEEIEESPAPAPQAVEMVVPSPVALREVDWQVLILSGPAGSGKSSVAYQLGQVLQKAAHIKVEPLRDRAYSTLLAQVIARSGTQHGDTGPLPSAWSGATTEGREKAVALAKEYLQDGYLVIIDDVIESVGELQVYQAGLEGIENRAVTLMPSEEEMERRDKMRPVDQRMGTRVSDARVQMAKLLSASSVVIDTSEDTVDATAQRILDALEELE